MAESQLVVDIDANGLSCSTSSSSTFDSPAGSKRNRGLLVCFQDVAYSIPAKAGAKHTIITGITGYFEAGKMTAVMGPSGSGKTTFLDVLAGRKSSGSLSGTIRYGGLPPSRSLLRRATGYVEQFDTLVDCLSCQEMLLYTAQLKRPRSESIAAKQAAVSQLLGKLGLAGCASSPIGNTLKRGISGGQAKRLNIGIALITDPRVLFLDEPTSGLDSFTANEVMRVVAGLAADGTTIATTIHSPSSYCYGLFDRLLLLLGGKLVYLGGAGEDAIAYFTATCSARQPQVGDNLAEWMLEAVTQAGRDGSDGSLAQAYHKSQQYRANLDQMVALCEEQLQRRARSATLQELAALSAAEAHAAAALQTISSSSSSGSGSGSNGYRECGCDDDDGRLGSSSSCLDCNTYVTPAWWSLKVLLQYRTLRNYRTPMYVLPRLLEKLLFAAVLLSLYWGKGTDFSTLNIPVLSSLLFLMVLAPICAAMMYLPSIGMERALYIRERNDGLYRPVTYLLFKLLDELLMMAPVTAGTTAAVFFACKLQGSYLLFWLVQYATLANGTALAYFLASISPGLMVAMPLLSFVLIVSLVCCGFMIRVAAMPAYWSWAVKANVVHYSWGALMINQYEGHKQSRLGSMNVLSYFGFAAGDAWMHLAIVVGFFFGWSFFTWLALAYARNYKR
uniref:ABC transporter domain-containing protein n=1 Tax=Tetradesmus obliquus TaxID=3088 RepID=A0A383VBA5_TETOB|eukprot:jgi/Sobl393_1/2121/SZX62845.1